MDAQTLIVGFAIALSLIFAGLAFARKAKGFSTKNDCGAGCGCESQNPDELG